VSDVVMAEVSDMAGPAALPRQNGTLAFDAPWQGRVFGLALAVVDRLDLGWEEFRSRLVAAIDEAPDRPYWESWTAALEALLRERGGVTLGQAHR
jgi:nitrile hydratase accessory protein